ncbi:MAG TPA: branched-chain amino acid ABC transporter permease [Thermodesulfobacteriota bacterium]|nr:branched-chain amino acid ABC transporter permease [Thermodesulfobacteriota bacterium]
MAFYLKVLEITCLQTIFVLGAYLMTGLTGLFSLGQGGFVLIGAYTAAIAYLKFHLAFPVAIALAVLVGSVIGFLIGIPTLRLHRDYFLLVTFGFGEMMRAALLHLAQLTGGALGIAGIPQLVGLPMILISIAVITFFIANLKRSRFGRNCIAIRDDELAASLMGIHVYGYKMKVFVLSSAITSYGGALYAFVIMFIEPNLFNWLESAKLIVITFVGGINSITGAIISSIIYYSFGEFFRFIDVWRDVLLAVSVLLVTIFRSQGIFGSWEFSPKRILGRRTKAT